MTKIKNYKKNQKEKKYQDLEDDESENESELTSIPKTQSKDELSNNKNFFEENPQKPVNSNKKET